MTIFDKTDIQAISIIVRRARMAAPAVASMTTQLELMMSMEACHRGPCPLRLGEMVNWQRDEDVVHDVFGIYKHYDRDANALTDCWTPRFAAPTRG